MKFFKNYWHLCVLFLAAILYNSGLEYLAIAIFLTLLLYTIYMVNRASRELKASYAKHVNVLESQLKDVKDKISSSEGDLKEVLTVLEEYLEGQIRDYKRKLS